ncbi:MAG: hypothetical protein QMD50_01175 [Patescibacteria group bacterium]|nr:hypothetical protein [Patescibacteria group bacterium]
MKPIDILSLSKSEEIIVNELKIDIETFARHQFRQLKPGEKQTHDEALSYELGMVFYRFRKNYDMRLLWALVLNFKEEGWDEVLLCLHLTNLSREEDEMPWIRLQFAREEVKNN